MAMKLLPYNGFIIVTLAAALISLLMRHVLFPGIGYAGPTWVLDAVRLVVVFGGLGCPIFSLLYTIQSLILLCDGQWKQVLISLLWLSFILSSMVTIIQLDAPSLLYPN